MGNRCRRYAWCGLGPQYSSINRYPAGAPSDFYAYSPFPGAPAAEIPQRCEVQEPGNCRQDKPYIVVVQVLADGSLRVNQEPVQWENLDTRLRGAFKVRADRTAFVRGDRSVEFAVAARVIDCAAGIAPISLLTEHLGNDF